MLVNEGHAPIDETTQSADTDEEAAAEGAPPPEMSETEVPVGVSADAAIEAETREVFYTFTWAGNRGGQKRPPNQGSRPEQKKGGGRPRGKGKRAPQPGEKHDAPRTFEARPARKDRIDPDNPFAKALMGLRRDDA
jgi:ATP-dependent RNA helicase SUPV3L1/SUV3